MTSAVENEGSGCVAYQGAPGAFSHEACLDLRPWDEAVGFETFQGAIDALLSGQCQFALIPVENSTVGVVEPAATLVREAGLVVVSEAWRPIRLALLGLPEARLSDIRTAESHPVALQQCSKALGELKIASVEVFDTGGAAAAVAEAGDLTRAAVAPARAAEVYGLAVLRNDLQDFSDNRTRFVLLSAPGA
ncbi:prephenate dehydratase [Brevundimonas bullata]|uniref:prephenate dehydratase n=1 Tax=Brevundimonas bullata TaxID=13160 RepID=A0A7W7IP02_9CAUL|nr:prephenate dehydratase domain-containing protein [Brevundimonas bullata]MBB4797400.1 prephenate dehydratase [Brevundimonas bullata]MBB6382359.1 prephenate dehydratase [Brevundimonas bullata]